MIDFGTLATSVDMEIFLKLVAALFLGMSLGIERALVGKTAGMRTYGLVAMGSALFVLVGTMAGSALLSVYGPGTLDPLRYSAEIISGIGFIGAGLIFFKDQTVTGVTTAAGIWVAAGIGMAIGYGLYSLALMTTLLALIVFTVLYTLERKLKAAVLHKEDINML